MEVNNYMTTPITGQGLNVCIPPDDELSSTSKKAAQNKVITEEFTNVSNAISQKQDATSYVTLSGTIVTQTGADNTMYLCGELAERGIYRTALPV